jgi:polysaccharide export outer membrane protein
MKALICPVVLSVVLGICTFQQVASAQTASASAPSEGGANLPAQKVGPNDMLALSVYESPELTRTIRVGADGMIRLPMLKQKIKAEGLMPGDLETVIGLALEEEELIVDPFVTVTIAEYHSKPVSVMGAVKSPVTLQADTPITLLDALAKAGGLSPEAGSSILVSRKAAAEAGQAGSALIQRIAVKDLIDAADPELNVILTGGEEVRVPEAGKIYVVGNVHKPGAFTIQNGNETTILKAVAQAEGLLQFASQQAYIYRVEGGTGAKNEIPVELGKIMERKTPDAPLMANDILYIPDNKRQRLTTGALEKLLMIGGGTAAALVYTLR